MIYTVTFNPAIDYVVHTDKIRLGSINRTRSENIYCGGKGINVSLVLAELGIKSKALGFVAGFTGAAIEQNLRDSGIDTDFVHLENGCSRINVKIKSEEETEVNGQGPSISAEKVNELYAKLDKLTEGDTLVLAGSIPSSMPDNVYEQILERLSGKGIRTVVDATGNLLMNVLKYRPFLIKPNNHELSDIFGVELNTHEQIAEYAEKLRVMGARNVLVSMAGDGAILVAENGGVYSCGVCKGNVVNSVGAGDSMVAGFIAGCEKGDTTDYGYALKLGTAAGGATAFSNGLANKELIDSLFSSIHKIIPKM